MSPGQLTICATPIGNLGDVSARLRQTLSDADAIYAEDTRRTAKLLSHLGISVETQSLFVGNEASRLDEVVARLASGESVVLVSDAGTPVISDPGAAVVRAVRDAGFEVTVVPGPSAVSTAIALSGFSGDRFTFEGFLPRKGRERHARIRSIATELRPVVLFCSPNRLLADLESLSEVCDPSRQVVIARELTKLHEEVWAGALSEATTAFSREVKGEVTVVVGPGEESVPDLDRVVTIAEELIASGTSLSKAADAISRSAGVSRNDLYRALVERQDAS